MAVQNRHIMRVKRHRRVRRKISGSAERPRMALYKSNTRLVVQFIDDDAGKTLVAVETGDNKNATAARDLGLAAAKAAREHGISRVVVDRGGFPFRGRIKAVVDAAVESGLSISDRAPAAAEPETTEEKAS